jgi:hypothetical protein
MRFFNSRLSVWKNAVTILSHLSILLQNILLFAMNILFVVLVTSTVLNYLSDSFLILDNELGHRFTSIFCGSIVSRHRDEGITSK